MPKKPSIFTNLCLAESSKAIVRFKDIESPEFPVPENEANKIMRIVLPIGGNTLIANDVPESMGPVSENENRSKIAVYAETKEEADKYSMVFQKGAKLKCLWRRALGVPILLCSEISTVSNGQ
jgi:uncharacterized glyoxalase superfamily protein PhnB